MTPRCNYESIFCGGHPRYASQHRRDVVLQSVSADDVVLVVVVFVRRRITIQLRSDNERRRGRFVCDERSSSFHQHRTVCRGGVWLSQTSEINVRRNKVLPREIWLISAYFLCRWRTVIRHHHGCHHYYYQFHNCCYCCCYYYCYIYVFVIIIIYNCYHYYF